MTKNLSTLAGLDSCLERNNNMAWGSGGEELRNQIKVDLSNMRINTYVPLRDMRKNVGLLKHAEKQSLLLKELDEIEASIIRMERTLNR